MEDIEEQIMCNWLALNVTHCSCHTSLTNVLLHVYTTMPLEFQWCVCVVLMTIVHVHIAASQKQSGQKRYQVNLRSQSAPIQVMLINRDSDSSVPVVFCVPPTDGVCPTPPSNPYSLQSFPNLSPTYSIPNTSTSSSSSSCYSSQGSFSSDHQMALPQYSDTLVQSFTPDKQIGKWGACR